MKKISSAYAFESKILWPTADNRIFGYDLARALALLGMLPINFRVLLDISNSDPECLVSILGFIQGRAAATFVVLAGVGLSLLSRRAYLNNDTTEIRANRHMLLRRALFLFVLGLLNSLIWPLDILHFYAFYFAIGTCMLTLSNRLLCSITIIPIAAFSVLMFMLDFDRGWDWEITSFKDLLQLPEILCHIFFCGQYPVFPWLAFLITGMWLGRQNLHDRSLRKKILLAGLGAAAFSECFSEMVFKISPPNLHGLDLENLLPWFTIEPWEPMPLFMISAGGTSLGVITFSIILSERYGNARWFWSLVEVGQLSLTLYVAHVVLGAIVLEMMQLFEAETYLFTVWGSALFYMSGMLFSRKWRKRFKKGPLEWLMRRFLLFHIQPKNAECVQA